MDHKEFDETDGAPSVRRDGAAENDASAPLGEDVPARLYDLPTSAAHAQDEADGVEEALAAFTFGGADANVLEGEDATSAEPRERPLVLGDDDPLDATIREEVESEELAWRGRIFSVDRMRVTLPDGNPAVRDVVRHPGAVAIVALTDEGRICLVRQYRTALDRVTVEVPAGKLDPGEDPLACARRELLEETGMEAQKIAYLTTIATSVGFCDELIHIYMATGLTFAAPDPDDDEFIHVDLVPLGDLVDAVLDGRIEDAKTVVGALICDAVSHRLDYGEA